MAHKSSMTTSKKNNADLPEVQLNGTTAHNISIDQIELGKKDEKIPPKPLSNSMKTLFTFSVLLAGVAIVLFLFAIPCPPPHDHRVWSISVVNASLSYPVELALTNNSQDYIIIMVVDSNQTSITTDDNHHQYLLALNSSNGHQLWKLNLNDTVTLLSCPGSLDKSERGYPFHCLVGTSNGELLAFEISPWTIVWRQSIILDSHRISCNSMAIISDIDNDNINDIMFACNSASSDKLSGGRLWSFLAASTGEVLRKSAVVADQQFVPNSLIVDNKSDAEVAIYFTINDGNMSSQVSSIRSRKLSGIGSTIDSDDANSKLVIKGGKINLPSILVDLNGDGYNDIVTTFSNGTVIATHGSTMARYWAFHLHESNIMK